MIRQGFQFNSEGEVLAFQVRVEGVTASTYKSGTNLYSKPFKHPTLNKWGYEVEVNESEQWSLIFEELNPNDINNLITFDSSWFPNVEI